MPKAVKWNQGGRVLFAVLPVIVLLCAGIWILQRATPIVEIESNDGVYDLSGVDLRHTIAELRRTVEYIPGELLTPEEFDARDDVSVGKIPGDTKVATMRARILVPQDVHYGVCGYSVNVASRIYVNGKWLYDEETPALTANEDKAFESFHLFTAQLENGIIEILIQTSSFSHADTSNGIQFHIGGYELCRVHYLRSMTSTILVMAWYLLMALVFLSLFFVLPEYKGNG